MIKLPYSKPEVLAHEIIQFETGLSNCTKIGTVIGTNPPEKVCLKPDHTWEPLP